MVIIDGAGVIVFVNIAAEKLFMKQRSELIGLIFGYTIAKENQEIVILQTDGKFKIGEVLFNPIIWEEKNATIASIRDITKQKEDAKIIERELKANETLILELSHRVNNNLQMLQSILRMQIRCTESSVCEEHLNDIMGRVLIMCLLHNKMYNSVADNTVKSRIFLRKTVEYVLSQLNINSEMEFNIDKCELDINIALPMGLMINEIFGLCSKSITNPDSRKIKFDFVEDNDHYKLSITDNMKGFIWENENKRISLKSDILNIMTKQLKGDIKLQTAKKIIITLKKIEKKTFGNIESAILR